MNQPHAPVRMRRVFADAVCAHMAKDRRIWVVTADLGYGMWDPLRKGFPERFINVGAAEQALLGIGIGLALEGRVPFLYSITPFLLYRAFESIRNYVDHESIPVKLIGAGRGQDYHEDGFSHWADEDREVMRVFPRIRAHWPADNEVIPALVAEMVRDPRPYYVNLRK